MELVIAVVVGLFLWSLMIRTLWNSWQERKRS